MSITGKFDDMTEKVKGLTDKGRYLATRSQQSLLKVPVVVFGAPRQLAHESHVSWWYVPVYIQPQSFHKKALEHCRVKLVSFNVSAPRSPYFTELISVGIVVLRFARSTRCRPPCL